MKETELKRSEHDSIFGAIEAQINSDATAETLKQVKR